MNREVLKPLHIILITFVSFATILAVGGLLVIDFGQTLSYRSRVIISAALMLSLLVFFWLLIRYRDPNAHARRAWSRRLVAVGSLGALKLFCGVSGIFRYTSNTGIRLDASFGVYQWPDLVAALPVLCCFHYAYKIAQLNATPPDDVQPGDRIITSLYADETELRRKVVEMRIGQRMTSAEIVEKLRGTHQITEEEIAYIIEDFHRIASKLLKSDPVPISQNSNRLLEDRPHGWEIKFFNHTLKDSCEKFIDRKKDLELGVSLGPSRAVSMSQLFDLARQEFAALSRLTRSLPLLMNEFNEAVADHDPDRIAYVARRTADIYHDVIEWALRWRSLVVQPEGERLVGLAQDLCETALLRPIQRFCEEVDTRAQQLHGEDGDVVSGINIVMRLDEPNVEPLLAELTRLGQLVE